MVSRILIGELRRSIYRILRDYAEFLTQLKEENKQRPSFLDEMGKILE